MDDYGFENNKDTNNGSDAINNDSANNYTYGGEDTYKAPNYYTESHRKTTAKRAPGLFQLALVALISSIIGGGIVFGAFQFVAPSLQPALNSYLSKVTGSKPAESAASTAGSQPAYKQIEITKSDSPVTAIAEKVSPSIVGIKTTAKVQDFFLGQREAPGEGSGIIIRSDGYIMTNNHVIESALSGNSNNMSNGSKIEVILPNQKDKTYEAKIIGRDAKTDLAVLKIEAANLPAVEMGNSDELKVGELAVAIGNPGGLEYMGSVTAGVISGLNRKIQTENGKELSLIQTDASINPGNSGGALVNSKGQVIGINTIKIVAQGFEGLGFAIPINTAKEITDNLIQYKYVKGRPYLGISVDPRFTPDTAKQFNVPAGLLVADVIPLSGAYKAGVQRNDIITKFDGKAITTFDELEKQKNTHKPGDEVQLEIYRDDKTITLKVVLTEDKG